MKLPSNIKIRVDSNFVYEFEVPKGSNAGKIKDLFKKNKPRLGAPHFQIHVTNTETNKTESQDLNLWHMYSVNCFDHVKIHDMLSKVYDGEFKYKYTKPKWVPAYGTCSYWILHNLITEHNRKDPYSVNDYYCERLFKEGYISAGKDGSTAEINVKGVCHVLKTMLKGMRGVDPTTSSDVDTQTYLLADKMLKNKFKMTYDVKHDIAVPITKK